MSDGVNELQELLDALLRRSKEMELAVFRGYINTEEHAVVDWDDELGDLWAFLETASLVGARMIYVRAWRFPEEELEEALLGNAEPDEDAEGIGAPTERDPRIESYRNRIGTPSMLDVLYRYDGVFHRWSKSAAWYEEFLALLDAEEVEEEEGSAEEDYTEMKRAREQLLNELATVLANDPRFPDCRNQEARLGLLRRIKPGINEECPSEHAQRAIVREAQAIFDLDVRPKLLANPSERARELKRQGFTIAQIASRLSIKAIEVKRILEEQESSD